MITARNVSKIFGKVWAVKEFTCQIPQASVVGLLGANGAGKTTVLKMLTGCLPPTTGQIMIGNYDILEDPYLAKQLLGFLPEHPPVYLDMKIEEYLRYMASLKSIPQAQQGQRIAATMEQCGIAGMGRQRIAHLSRGYRQRTALAQALLADPAVLILDEPTSAQDPLQIQQIRALLKTLAKTKTILLSTHILSEVEQICDQVIILHKGRIALSGQLPALIQSLSLENVYLQATQAERVV